MRSATPLVNGDVAALTRFFDRDQFVALIRPDHIVGAIADPTKPDHAAGRRSTWTPSSHAQRW
ncbi:MAG: hypothetical protein ACRDRB_07965 [Pseudonocardiaceae bacterium]